MTILKGVQEMISLLHTIFRLTFSKIENEDLLNQPSTKDEKINKEDPPLEIFKSEESENQKETVYVSCNQATNEQLKNSEDELTFSFTFPKTTENLEQVLEKQKETSFQNVKLNNDTSLERTVEIKDTIQATEDSTTIQDSTLQETEIFVTPKRRKMKSPRSKEFTSPYKFRERKKMFLTP